MEYFKNLNLTTTQIIKAITQLLVSVSLFYYIFFHASSRSYFLLHSLKFYLSAISLHPLDKRWIFLICNGILVILSNTSGLVRFPSGVDHDNQKIRDHHLQLHTPAAVDSKGDVFLEEEEQVLLLESAEEAENAVSENHENNDRETNQEDYQEGSQNDRHQCSLDEEQVDNLSITVKDEEQLEPAGAEGEEIRINITEDDEENENYSEDGFDPWEEQVQAVQGEEEEGRLENLSAEELNKKFEDFIRKMKEELRIEAQQHHLVMVK